jgi:predicted RNA binding protein with dsRBD fold (UPF0201 family)
MATLSAIWNILKLIPQIWSIFKAINLMVKEANEIRIEMERKEALAKLQKAKTEKEVLDAAEDYLNRPK